MIIAQIMLTIKLNVRTLKSSQKTGPDTDRANEYILTINKDNTKYVNTEDCSKQLKGNEVPIKT